MTKLQKFTLISALYIAQGLPYGFFTQALPVLLRKSGLSLLMIGLTHFLTLPWALKFLWAPLVDRTPLFHWNRLGLRRSWLLPLQGISIVVYLVLAPLPLQSALPIALGAFLLTNFIAAAQDVATDALAIDILQFDERGWANGIQVAGYRLGMIIGGGALLAIYDQIQWFGLMLAMAFIIALTTWPVLVYRETLFVQRTNVESETSGPRRAIVRLLKEVLHFFTLPGSRLWLIVLLLYKFGHASATAMLRPWLVDHGYGLSEIAVILGSAGFVAGFVGAIFGGALASRYSRTRLLIILGALQFLGVTLYLWPALTEHSVLKVMIAASVDHFTSGMATTVLFALMMDTCRRDRAAADYTAQACTVVVAQSAASVLAGFSAERFGYDVHFFLSAAVAGLAMIGIAKLIRGEKIRALLRTSLNSTPLIAFLFFAFFLAGTPRAHAQADPGNADSEVARNSYDVGVVAGSLLPAGIGGVRDVLPLWGLRGSVPTPKGVFEGLVVLAHAKGVVYNSGALDYRYNIPNDMIPLHMTFGIHLDEYEGLNRALQISGGWQFGAGVSQVIVGSLLTRAEFVYRFGPGQSLLVLVGLTYRFSK